MRLENLIFKLRTLKEVHGNLRVGFTGHYGEFFELEDDIEVETVDREDPVKIIPKEMVAVMVAPNIGEEPDWERNVIRGSWKGANEAGIDNCEMCGDYKKLRTIHYVGPAPVPKKDHLNVCVDCFHVLNMPGWHACGCGG